MKILLILSLLSLSSFVNAESFKISGEYYNFKEDKGFLTYGCDQNCIAVKKVMELKNVNLKKLRVDEKFSGSVGSDICRLSLKSNSLIGLASNKDQRAFCVFPDNSMIELNSLGKYLIEKHIVTE